MRTDTTHHRSTSNLPGRRRISALDGARGLAVIGMVIVNTGPRGGDSVLETIYRLPYGRASLLFVLLGGIGLSLLTREARQMRERVPLRALVWRSGLLLALGLVLQTLGHGVSVILATYAVLILLTIPLVRASERTLWGVVGLSAAVGPLIWIAVQSSTEGGFDRYPISTGDSLPGVLGGVLVTGAYPVVVWIAPFVFGMWLGRQNLAAPTVSTRLIVWGAAAAIGGRLLSLLLVWVLGEPTDHLIWQRTISSVAHSQMPLWLISGVGSAVLVLGVCLKIGTWTRVWLRPFSALGRLALTAYVAHLVVLALVVRPGPDSLLSGVMAASALIVALMALATLWLSRFSQGPFEWALRPPRFRPRSAGQVDEHQVSTELR